MILKCISAAAAVVAALKTIGEALWMLPLYFVYYFAIFFFVAVVYCVVICGIVDMKKPLKQENRFYRTMMYPYVELLMNLFLVKMRTQGLEKTPKDGRFLLVCNHQQFADPGVLLHCFRKSQLTFISKQENQKLPIINKFMHSIRCQFIDRDNDRQALRAIVECIRMIKADEASVGVFPEGYTSKDGKVHHFRPGVFKIAMKTNVPIVVCTINGTGQLFQNIKQLRKSPVDLHLVDVIPPQAYAGKTTVELSDMVYEMMIADLGEDFRAEA